MKSFTITLSGEPLSQLKALVRYHNVESKCMTQQSLLMALITKALNEVYESEVDGLLAEYKALSDDLDAMRLERSETANWEDCADYDHDIANAEKKEDALAERMQEIHIPVDRSGSGMVVVHPSFARAMLSPFPYSLALAPRTMRRIAQRKRDYKRIFYRRALRHPAFTVDTKQTRYLHFRRCLRRKAVAKGFVAIGVGVWYDPGSDYHVTVSTAY